MYFKCSPVVDANGSELAFGGRKGRSVKEALLVLKLIQDCSNWMKSQTVKLIKFLDVEKFFDTLNFKKALIKIYESGVDGQYWQAYK